MCRKVNRFFSRRDRHMNATRDESIRVPYRQWCDKNQRQVAILRFFLFFIDVFCTRLNMDRNA